MSPEPLNGTFPLLSLLIWLPILAGAVTLAFGNARPNAARWFAVASSVLVSVSWWRQAAPAPGRRQWNPAGTVTRTVCAPGRRPPST